MGHVLTNAKMENLRDLWAVQEGRLPADQARLVTVSDALVDSGATTLAMPTRLIHQLGLQKAYERACIYTRGESTVQVFDAVRLTIMDRFLSVDVMEVPDGVPVLIGQISLEMLDLVVDARQQRLTGNPAHKGEHVLELL